MFLHHSLASDNLFRRQEGVGGRSERRAREASGAIPLRKRPRTPAAQHLSSELPRDQPAAMSVAGLKKQFHKATQVGGRREGLGAPPEAPGLGGELTLNPRAGAVEREARVEPGQPFSQGWRRSEPSGRGL